MDWWLEDPARLEGHPKRTIAGYVEDHGICVPRRFETIEEANRSGVPIIARSEHRQDYDGVSGLLESPGFEPGRVPDEKDILGSMGLSDRSVRRYATLISHLTLTNESSFSLWEFLPGLNSAIIADSAILGRYHVMTKRTSFGSRHDSGSYVMIDEGKRTVLSPEEPPRNVPDRLDTLIELYEGIRKLDRFDPDHCPIMEFQSTDDTDYFLQYVRSRDFEPASFELDGREASQYPITFTRGSTPPEGIEVDVTVLHAFNHGRHARRREQPAGIARALPAEEDGALDLHYDRVYTKTMVARRTLQLIEANNGPFEFLKFADGHRTREVLFRPRISLVIENSWLDEAYPRLQRECQHARDAKIRMHVVSDGRSATLNDAKAS